MTASCHPAPPGWHTGLRGPAPLTTQGRAALRHVRYQGDRIVSVGYKLYRLVRDLAPQDWTSGELVVALMIADSSGESTLRSYLDAAELSRRARMSDRGVRKNLEKLAERGFEFRVRKGTDKTGKAIYAVSGDRTDYQVPDIFLRLARGAEVAYGLVDKLASGGTTVPPDAQAAGGLSTGWPVPQYRLRRYHSTG